MDFCPITGADHCWVRLDDPDRQESPGLELCALCQQVRELKKLTTDDIARIIAARYPPSILFR